jgi:hypothetical protein
MPVRRAAFHTRRRRTARSRCRKSLRLQTRANSARRCCAVPKVFANVPPGHSLANAGGGKRRPAYQCAFIVDDKEQAAALLRSTKEAAEQMGTIHAPITTTVVQTIVQPMPMQAMPIPAMAMQGMPMQAMPTQAMPTQAMPTQAMPMQTMRVECPAGCKGGDSVTIQAPSGQMCTVVIPPGLNPGDAFEAQVQAMPMQAVPMQAVPGQAMPMVMPQGMQPMPMAMERPPGQVTMVV